MFILGEPHAKEAHDVVVSKSRFIVHMAAATVSIVVIILMHILLLLLVIITIITITIVTIISVITVTVTNIIIIIIISSSTNFEVSPRIFLPPEPVSAPLS